MRLAMEKRTTKVSRSRSTWAGAEVYKGQAISSNGNGVCASWWPQVISGLLYFLDPLHPAQKTNKQTMEQCSMNDLKGSLESTRGNHTSRLGRVSQHFVTGTSENSPQIIFPILCTSNSAPIFPRNPRSHLSKTQHKAWAPTTHRGSSFSKLVGAIR